jgi:chromosome segregation ATPase
MPWPPDPPSKLAQLRAQAAALLQRRQSIDQALRSGPTDPRLLDAAEEGRSLLAEREQVQRELAQVQEQIKELAAAGGGWPA